MNLEKSFDAGILLHRRNKKVKRKFSSDANTEINMQYIIAPVKDDIVYVTDPDDVEEIELDKILDNEGPGLFRQFRRKSCT
jgi:hypothetical protein